MCFCCFKPFIWCVLRKSRSDYMFDKLSPHGHIFQKKKKIYRILLCNNIHQDIIFHLELMYPTCFSHSFVTDSSPPGTFLSPQGQKFQFSVALTWMEDKIFPILWKSGVTRMSVRLLHIMWIDGKSIMKLWIIGITTLEEEGQRVTFLGMEVSSQISVLN